MQENRRSEDEIIQAAIDILASRLRADGEFLRRRKDIKNFFTINYGQLEREAFGVVLLDIQGRYLDHKVLFLGSVMSAVVSPREVVKYALKHNASKALLFHNHPSGTTKPTAKDIELTDSLYNILGYVDVQIWDHFIITKDDMFSFMENNIMTYQRKEN